ncbi:MAG: hypothetical protein KKA70_10755 [Proteobacteria bacterium]|nr:hypothetical protein [Pseudomonadota bacterium]
MVESQRRKIIVTAGIMFFCAVFQAMLVAAQANPPALILTVTATIEQKVKLDPAVGSFVLGREASSVARQSIVADGRRYYITAKTELISNSGSRLSMESLPVPCKALIHYQPLQNNDPNAVKIVVQSVNQGASILWETPGPQ